MGEHSCVSVALVVASSCSRVRQAACCGAAALLLAVLVWQPAVASERSQQLVSEARALMRATPPRSVEATLKLIAATEADPTDKQAWLARGALALKLLSYREALFALDRAAALGPDTPNLQFLRGRALFGLARPDEALAAYDREANKDGNPTFWLYRGIAAQGARQYARALADYDKSDQVFPDGRQTTQLQRGDIHIAQGKVAEAEAAYAAAVALDPKSQDAAAAEERLKVLRQPGREAGPATPQEPPATPQEPKRFFARVFSGVEYDSNVALVDRNTVPPAQLAQKDDGRVVGEVSARYFLILGEQGYLGVNGDWRGSWNFHNVAYDDQLLGGSVFGAAYFDRVRVGAELRYGRSWLGYTGYSSAINATVWTSYRFDPRNETTIAFQDRWQTFDARPVDVFRNREGNTPYLSLTHTWRAYSDNQSFFEIEPAVRWGRESTIGGYFDNSEWAGFLTARWQFEYFQYPTLIEAGLALSATEYVNAGAQLAVNANGVVRYDQNFGQALRVVQPLHRNFGLEGRYRHGNNYSNVTGFSYSSDVFRLGVVGWF